MKCNRCESDCYVLVNTKGSANPEALCAGCATAVITNHLGVLYGCKMPESFTEVWYEFESSPAGTTDEWVKSGYGQYDTREAMDKKLVELRDLAQYPGHAGFQFRPIRVTHIEEVI